MNKALFSILILLFLSSCDDDIKLKDNPLTQEDQKETDIDTNSYDAYGVFGLHKDLFKPTCANSGCHDGNFEPDFRTVESSYYSLINSPVIKADANGGFDLRVKPHDADNSMLIRRLKVDLNGNSGIMPLGLETNSDYPDRKAEFINRLETWINNGAEDMYGNTPSNGNFPPICEGVTVMQNGVKSPRIGIYEPVNVDASKSVSMYFSFFDKETPQNIEALSFQMSTAPDSFVNQVEQPITTLSSSITDKGLFGAATTYKFKSDLSLDTAKSLDVYWLRVKVTDGIDTIYIPSEQSMFSLKKYFAIRIQ